MNRQQIIALCRYVQACCPQQRLDEHTPDAWIDLLGDLDYDIAKRAAAEVARRQPFVSPSEIHAQVARERRRLATEVHQRLPIEERPPTDAAGYLAWARRRQRRETEVADAIAAGRMSLDELPALEPASPAAGTQVLHRLGRQAQECPSDAHKGPSDASGASG